MDIKSIISSVSGMDDVQELEQLRDSAALLRNATSERLRVIKQDCVKISDLLSYDSSDRCVSAVLAESPPWKNIRIPQFEIPGMITDEEAQYYMYIGRFFSGIGEAIELGPWLGKSTNYITLGLQSNPNFRGKKLNVYDDFVWRKSWMDGYVSEEEALDNHADFRSLFQKYTRQIEPLLNVGRARIVAYDGNDHVPLISWIERPIELMYVDCGRSYEINQGWWQVFSPYFIRNRTLVILQDWRTHLEVPVKWFNQMDIFTDSKGNELQLVHELKDGNIGTFLFI